MTSRDGIGPWRRSSYSGVNGDCVEVAALAARDGRAVRDSKDPCGPMLTFGDAEWSAFLDGARRGAFASGR
jgi:hypothetical protein